MKGPGDVMSTLTPVGDRVAGLLFGALHCHLAGVSVLPTRSAPGRSHQHTEDLRRPPGQCAIAL